MGKKFGIIGGDKRNFFLKEELKKDNNIVKSFGLDEQYSLDEVINTSEYIISAMPFTKDNINIFAPLSNSEIKIKTLCDKLNKNKILFAGGFNDNIKNLFSNYNFKYADILAQENFNILNAIPTSEGAIKIAIENTDYTLQCSKTFVMGYGNIGKRLAFLLNSFGSNVYVSYNDNKSKAEIQSNNFIPVNIKEINQYISDFDIIFNTVPFVLINESNIKKLNNSTLYIEIASHPYGMDFDLANKYKKNYIKAPALPGKIAPKTMASYIKNSIYMLLKQFDID